MTDSPTESARLAPVDRVVAHEDKGEGFLLHLDTGCYYTLNRAGMAVWRALESGADPVAALRARYPTTPEADIARDVDVVLTEFQSARLVAPQSAR